MDERLAGSSSTLVYSSEVRSRNSTSATATHPYSGDFNRNVRRHSAPHTTKRRVSYKNIGGYDDSNSYYEDKRRHGDRSTNTSKRNVTTETDRNVLEGLQELIDMCASAKTRLATKQPCMAACASSSFSNNQDVIEWIEKEYSFLSNEQDRLHTEASLENLRQRRENLQKIEKLLRIKATLEGMADPIRPSEEFNTVYSKQHSRRSNERVTDSAMDLSPVPFKSIGLSIKPLETISKALQIPGEVFSNKALQTSIRVSEFTSKSVQTSYLIATPIHNPITNEKILQIKPYQKELYFRSVAIQTSPSLTAPKTSKNLQVPSLQLPSLCYNCGCKVSQAAGAVKTMASSFDQRATKRIPNLQQASHTTVIKSPSPDESRKPSYIITISDSCLKDIESAENEKSLKKRIRDSYILLPEQSSSDQQSISKPVGVRSVVRQTSEEIKTEPSQSSLPGYCATRAETTTSKRIVEIEQSVLDDAEETSADRISPRSSEETEPDEIYPIDIVLRSPKVSSRQADTMQRKPSPRLPPKSSKIMPSATSKIEHSTSYIEEPSFKSPSKLYKKMPSYIETSPSKSPSRMSRKMPLDHDLHMSRMEQEGSSLRQPSFRPSSTSKKIPSFEGVDKDWMEREKSYIESSRAPSKMSKMPSTTSRRTPTSEGGDVDWIEQKRSYIESSKVPSRMSRRMPSDHDSHMSRMDQQGFSLRQPSFRPFSTSRRIPTSEDGDVDWMEQEKSYIEASKVPSRMSRRMPSDHDAHMSRIDQQGSSLRQPSFRPSSTSKRIRTSEGEVTGWMGQEKSFIEGSSSRAPSRMSGRMPLDHDSHISRIDQQGSSLRQPSFRPSSTSKRIPSSEGGYIEWMEQERPYIEGSSAREPSRMSRRMPSDHESHMSRIEQDGLSGKQPSFKSPSTYSKRIPSSEKADTGWMEQEKWYTEAAPSKSPSRLPRKTSSIQNKRRSDDEGSFLKEPAYRTQSTFSRRIPSSQLDDIEWLEQQSSYFDEPPFTSPSVLSRRVFSPRESRMEQAMPYEKDPSLRSPSRLSRRTPSAKSASGLSGKMSPLEFSDMYTIDEEESFYEEPYYTAPCCRHLSRSSGRMPTFEETDWYDNPVYKSPSGISGRVRSFDKSHEKVAHKSPSRVSGRLSSDKERTHYERPSFRSSELSGRITPSEFSDMYTIDEEPNYIAPCCRPISRSSGRMPPFEEPDWYLYEDPAYRSSFGISGKMSALDESEENPAHRPSSEEKPAYKSSSRISGRMSSFDEADEDYYFDDEDYYEDLYDDPLIDPDVDRIDSQRFVEGLTSPRDSMEVETPTFTKDPWGKFKSILKCLPN